jgi:hypothetical protein
MDDINFHLYGNITQSNLSGNNKIEITGKITKEEESAPEEPQPTKENKKNYKKFLDLKNEYLKILIAIVVGSIVFWGIAVLAYQIGFAPVDPTNIILTFVGILATFIVVSNYMQVKEVKDNVKNIIGEYKNKIDVLEGKIEQINITDLNRKIDENEKSGYIFSEFKRMYYDLLRIKGEPNFKQLGLVGTNSPYNYWYVKIQELKTNPECKLLGRKELLFSELEELGYAYEASKGEETDATKVYHNYFKIAFCKSWK